MSVRSEREAVRRALARRPPRATSATLTRAAVLCPLVEDGEGLAVLLTRRSENLPDHAGQISFPGGRIGARDASPVDAALREAREEVGLDPAGVEVVGALPAHATATGFLIHPFVGFVAKGFEPRVDRREVAEAFTVPLAHVTDPRNLRRESLAHGGKTRSYYAIPFDGYHIWGATAGILKSLSDLLERESREG